MDLESFIADCNSNYFLREFTYTAARFRASDNQERELCDGAIWIGDVLIVIQMKERNPDHASDDPEIESKWFHRKVSKAAVKQLSQSHAWLDAESTLPLANLRSQIVDISAARPSCVHNVVIYQSAANLQPVDTCLKGRHSKRLGFVHFIHAHDYSRICATLITPMEISDYLSFRADAATRNPQTSQVPEKALVGKYLSDTGIHGIHDTDSQYVDMLIDSRNDWSVHKLLQSYFDRIVSGNNETEYHAILTELAKLPRNAMKLFRQRLLWAMEKCTHSAPPTPSRFHFPATDCCFIFIPLSTNERDCSYQAALNYTTICKYDFRSTRAIGLAVSPHTIEGQHHIQWCFLNQTWERSDKIDAFITEEQPLRKVDSTLMGKYEFRA